jgi:cell surface protein SprA
MLSAKAGLPLLIIALMMLCEIAVAQQGSRNRQVSRSQADAAQADTLPRIVPFRSVGHNWIISPFPARISPLLHIRMNEDRMVIQKDSLGNYVVQRRILNMPASEQVFYDFETMSNLNMRSAKTANWRRLVREAERRRDLGRGLLDFRIAIPGGRSSAFTTIFGKPEVNLRVTGTANMNLGASIRETEDPAIPPNQQRRVDPLFNQNLKLNIQGTIGDKLTIRTDWDTERTFDFENRLNIVYQGYDDEILQTVELGNVSMETGNSLIRGGGSLFGIKSKARIGALEVTSVLSQQEGKGQSQTISGGSQTRDLNVAPNNYEDDRHFFLDFYARQEFEDAMADPVVLRRLFNIINIEVYLLNVSSQSEVGQRLGVALLDKGVRTAPDGTFFQPDEDFDPFSEAFLDQFRDPSTSVSEAELGVESSEMAQGYFIPLIEGVDYTVNQDLGYISLGRRLEPRQALAVSFSYRDPSGNIIYVGDINQGDNQRIFLKLLRPQNQSPSARAWDLTMRNIYSLNANNLTRESLELDVFYTGATTDQTNLPGINNILLRDLGLDRVGPQGDPGPDNSVDFNTGTLDPANGRIIFPYLEPFGQRIEDLINNSALSEEAKQEARDRLVFRELYTSTIQTASQNSKNSIYRIKGQTRGGVSDSYFLGIGLVEGSVRVTANGVELGEGTDYEVDFITGSIIITNRRYLTPGQEIRIDYESQQLLQIQQTTFTGLRAQYNVSDQVAVGGTYFRLNERPLQDKIPIGDEPISNTTIGLDATANFEAPWLTRAIDWLPLIQTRSPSRISLAGEWAQLRPSVSQTNAVRRAINDNRLFPDEENGLAFIDEFEGAKTSISLMGPGRWSLAAAPYALPGIDMDLTMAGQSIPERIRRSDLRAQFSWYSISSALIRTSGANPTVESLPVAVRDVFPNREVRIDEQELQTLDIYYNPRDRGPYNYNRDLRDQLENEPETMWGGMTTVLPGGLSDLTQNNVEFLEFWVQSILPDGRAPTGQDIFDYDGSIYIDIGTVNEDVIPNNLNNTEDGLADRSNNLRPDRPDQPRSYVIASPVEQDGQFSVANIELEDVGLDGAPSTGGIDGFSEQVLFADFIDRMQQVYSDDPVTFERILSDPSNDRFVYFNDPTVRNLPLHERFHRMYGYYEGNAQTSGASRAVTNRPDSEGLLNPAVVNLENSFFQYELNWNPADTSSLDIGNNYIVDKVDGGQQWNTWYQVRIPLRDIIRQIGNIENLQQVTHIRIWMSGYREPFTLRFATLELVGNQWRKAEEIGNAANINTLFEVSTINIEENSNRQPVPYRIPRGAIRSQVRGQQETIQQNEQSMALSVLDLRPGDTRLVRRFYPAGLDLLNYSNMRMFVHGEGYSKREDIELVVRMGTNLENNYYEYRQPLTPTDTTHRFTQLSADDQAAIDLDTELIWLPDENSMNLVLSSFNQLKQLRNLDEVTPDEIYERRDIVIDAPPGTVLAMRGNPSLGQITEIGIGIRNPFDAKTAQPGQQPLRGVPSLDAEVWVNELRVSGFDDRKGWAAKFNARVDMADVASVNAQYNRSTDGYGALESRINERNMNDQESYSFSSSFNVHKLVPERYGWNMPVSFSVRRSVSTPRYLPREGDIRFSDFRDAVEAAEPDETERERLIDEKLDEIQTFDENYTFNISNLTKRNSESNLLKYTVDNLNFNYNYSTSSRSSPTQEFSDDWNYRLGLGYNLSIPNISTVRPLFFLENMPVLNLISGIRLAYVPSNITMQTGLNRRYNESRRRSFDGQDPFPLQQQHTFNWTKQFAITYNISPPVQLGMNINSSHNLANLGVTETADSLVFRTRSTFDVFNDIITGDTIKPRLDTYNESYNASFRPRLNRIRSLNWITYSATYRGGFNWQNTAQGSGLGANLSNSLNLSQTSNIRFQELLKKIPFYDRSLQADQQETRERERRKRVREQQRQREREQRARDQEHGDGVGRGEASRNTTRTENQQAEQESFTMSENIMFYGRRFMLGLVSFQSFDFTYTHGQTSRQGGYDGGTSPLNMFNDINDASFSPTFLYRIGIQNNIPINQIVRPDELSAINVTRFFNNTDDLSLRSRMQPFRDITIDLDWSTGWNENNNFTQTIFSDSIATQINQSGGINATVWAFGGGYESFFRSQLQAAFDDIRPGSTIIDDQTGNQDGRTVLGRRTLEEDFRRSYIFGGSTTFGDKNFIPLPLPNWNVQWTGWEKRLPFIKQYLTRATISHRYQGRYRTDWAFNPDFGAGIDRRVGNFQVLDTRPEFEASSITLERSFSPFIQLSLTWKSGLTTSLQYDRSQITTFSLSNSNVIERNSSGVRFSANYSKRGFRLPFMRRFQNTLNLRLSVSYNEDVTNTFLLNTDLQQVLQLGQDDLILDQSLYNPGEPNVRGDNRIQIAPLIGYEFSQTVKMNLEYTFFKLMPKSSNIFPRTDQDIRFNIIVSIRSN